MPAARGSESLDVQNSPICVSCTTVNHACVHRPLTLADLFDGTRVELSRRVLPTWATRGLGTSIHDAALVWFGGFGEADAPRCHD
jgi:hypothetical protein